MFQMIKYLVIFIIEVFFNFDCLFGLHQLLTEEFHSVIFHQPLVKLCATGIRHSRLCVSAEAEIVSRHPVVPWRAHAIAWLS